MTLRTSRTIPRWTSWKRSIRSFNSAESAIARLVVDMFILKFPIAVSAPVYSPEQLRATSELHREPHPSGSPIAALWPIHSGPLPDPAVSARLRLGTRGWLPAHSFERTAGRPIVCGTPHLPDKCSLDDSAWQRPFLYRRLLPGAWQGA